MLSVTGKFAVDWESLSLVACCGVVHVADNIFIDLARWLRKICSRTYSSVSTASDPHPHYGTTRGMKGFQNESIHV